ncbi:hypothetical protein A11A3_00485 [Alcanivorax hongdengensis A-11-3]|uniref:Uncharacterized protein n=1 Tax=Alcanivorax hongdengensis A-11-3 TaxID=1177179 RepID=L0WJD0_9GAMM|nr:hypothetical protein [Alcanivorax hongdengensis]EKF75925.1 hypothetical protein A11A3_00485 [Alcanivorax hongdengensis A-11-3]
MLWPVISPAQTGPDDQARQLAQVLGPRPQINDYDNQDRFVTDLLAWEQHRSALKKKLARGESIAPPAPAKPHDWHHVTGPEDLDTALQNAKGYQQPHYKAKLRYNRTTHISFPLPRLPRQQLSRETVPGVMAPLQDQNAARAPIPEELLEETEQLQREQPRRPDMPPSDNLVQTHQLTQVEAR